MTPWETESEFNVNHTLSSTRDVLLHPGCFSVWMTACVCGRGDLQQGRKGDGSQVILRGIREEFEKFLGFSGRAGSSTEGWVKKTSGLASSPRQLWGRSERFDKQPSSVQCKHDHVFWPQIATGQNIHNPVLFSHKNSLYSDVTQLIYSNVASYYNR